MIKDILVKLEPDASRDGASDYAISLAEAFGAHLTGVAFASAGRSNFVLPGIPADVLPETLTETLTEEAAVARSAVQRFAEAAQRRLASIEPRLITEGDLSPSTVFSRMARRFDLSVVMQSDRHSHVSNDSTIEAVLFESGRPVLIVPYTQRDGLKLDRILCCWDGSRAAARAVNDALPLLRRTTAVELVIVDQGGNEPEPDLRGVEIRRHLARHGVDVEIQILHAVAIEVADVILSYVADCSANMIVMGGYGHSRLREFVFGGVTLNMLSSMTIPVFMSH
jgi:nucleotide-binding universal stress UspA family protein